MSLLQKSHDSNLKDVGRIRYHTKGCGYLLITNKLKRLYQSEKTDGAMRWHAEHFQTDGEVFQMQERGNISIRHTQILRETFKMFILGYFTNGLVHSECLGDNISCGHSFLRSTNYHQRCVWNGVFIHEHISPWSEASKIVSRCLCFYSAIYTRVEGLMVIKGDDV